MDRIIFSDEGHKYHRESDGCRLMSVSHVKALFSPEFRREHNARKSAAQKVLKTAKYGKLKDAWEAEGKHILDPAFIIYLEEHIPHKETYERVVQEIKDSWRGIGNIAAGKGSTEHSLEEEKAIKDGFALNLANGLEYPTQPHGKQPDGSNRTVVASLNELEPGFYPELLIWFLFPEPFFSKSMGCEVCGIAGQSDMVFIEPDCSFVDDFKFTTDPLTDFAISYKNFGEEYHPHPWDDWKATKISPYRIQLNLYGWMLDQHFLPPKDLRIRNHGRSIPIRYEPQRVSETVSKLFMESL